MFQSNLLDSLSSTWNLSHVRNIVKIPDDQLEILNSIPEWSSNQEEPAQNKSPTALENSDKSTSEVLVTDLKEVTASISSLKFSENSGTNKENNTLQKEMSKVAVFSDSPNKHFEKRSHVGPDGGIVIDKTLDQHDFKSQYTNSAVQCQMSQSSQSNFEETSQHKIFIPSIDVSVLPKESYTIHKEMPLSSTGSILHCDNIPDVNDSNKEASKCNYSAESQGFIVDSVSVNNFKDSSNLAYSLTALERKEECSNYVEVTGKDIEESFVSQPMPCAQPSLPKESYVIQKEVPLSSMGSTLHCDDIPNVKSNTELESSDKGSHQHGGKRKRKAKIEKTKKLRSTYASNNKILYSPDQIKSMINLIKVFNKL